MIPNYFS